MTSHQAGKSERGSWSSFSVLDEDENKNTLPMKLGQKSKLYDVTNPRFVVDNFYDSLTTYMKEEIRYFPAIYYFGEKTSKKTSNYDDGNTYKIVKFDQVYYRYELGDLLGKGGYGVVVEAYDHKENELVAIKILKKNKLYDPYREVQFLKLVQKIDDPICSSNFVQMKNYFWYRGYLMIVFERLSFNIYHLMNFEPFSRENGFGIDTVRTIVHSLVECLYVLNKNNLVHCDIKPANVLLNKSQKGSLFKLGDFGLTCYFKEMRTRYNIQTQYYAAPETILRGHMTPAIDMWSLGCLVAELYTGNVLFKGRNKKHQITLIVAALGEPPNTILKTFPPKVVKLLKFNRFLEQSDVSEDSSEATLSPETIGDNYHQRAAKATASLKRIIGAQSTEHDDMIDFIRQCLDWDYRKRLVPAAALHHRFLRKRLSTSMTGYKYANFVHRAGEIERHTEILSEGRRGNNTHYQSSPF